MYDQRQRLAIPTTLRVATPAEHVLICRVVAYGSDRPALDELASLITAVATDAGRPRQIVALAEQRDFQFDD